MSFALMVFFSGVGEGVGSVLWVELKGRGVGLADWDLQCVPSVPPGLLFLADSHLQDKVSEQSAHSKEKQKETSEPVISLQNQGQQL